MFIGVCLCSYEWILVDFCTAVCVWGSKNRNEFIRSQILVLFLILLLFSAYMMYSLQSKTLQRS